MIGRVLKEPRDALVVNCMIARTRYHRKIIHIAAEDSPSVRLGMHEVAGGKKPSLREVLPGVLSYHAYKLRRATWDIVRQCIGLDGRFYEGPEQLLYPPIWLNLAGAKARGQAKRKGITMGVDSAMGNDNTTWAICDHQGLIYLEARQTPDTTEVVSRTLALASEYVITPDNILFDLGGGGKQHGDILRKRGGSWAKVRIIAFGTPATNEKKRGRSIFKERVEGDERRYIYKNRRCEMYGELRRRLDPDENPNGFGIPEKYTELRRQMAPLPLDFDGEGRMVLPPKNKQGKEDTRETIKDMIGCSPDELDALVLAHFGLVRKSHKRILKSLI